MGNSTKLRKSDSSVDAWAIWDPFYSAIDLEGKARLLADGQGLGLIGPFMLGARGYVEANGTFVGQLLDEISRAEALTRSDEAGSIQLLAKFMGLPEEVVRRSCSHRPASPVIPVSNEIIAAQQQQARPLVQFLEHSALFGWRAHRFPSGFC